METYFADRYIIRLSAMHKNQFYHKYSSSNSNDAEMRRRWEVHLREQEEMEMRMRMAAQNQSNLNGFASYEYMDNDYMIDELNYVL
jgi:hypothetical protein